MIRSSHAGRVVVSLLVLALAARGATADDAAVVATARDLLAKHQEAIVWVSAVVTIQIPGGARAPEQEAETLGTVVDPSGLAIISLEAMNPVTKLMRLGMNLRAQGINLRDIKSELSQVKIRLADGTEVPSKVVLEDSDLGLAFLRPEPPAEGTEPRKFASISLETGGAAEVLDQVIELRRLGKTLDSEPSVSLERVTAVVKKPRELFCTSTHGEGTPVFTADGKLLGIGIMNSEGSTVVVPTVDIVPIADQAKESAPTEAAPAADAAPQ
ncbi:MAG: serine protease [Pirellulales bacterium]|nr:serine protease [Pirellulales bacterium]